MMKVSVFGLGYVGAVSCACLAELGHSVVGVDTNADKVRMVNDGSSPVVEDQIDELMAAGVAAGRVVVLEYERGLLSAAQENRALAERHAGSRERAQ